MNRKMHLSKVKHSKFNESGQLLVFYLASAVWGADIILRVSLVTWGLGELWAEIIWKVGMLTMKQTASLLSVYLLENLTSQKGTLCSSIFPLLGTRRYFLWLLVTGLMLGEDGFSVQMNKNEYKLKSFINQFHFKKLPVMVSRNVNMRMWHGTWFHSCDVPILSYAGRLCDWNQSALGRLSKGPCSHSVCKCFAYHWMDTNSIICSTACNWSDTYKYWQ